MKKVLSILVLAITICACQTDVSLNDKYFEGQRDGAFWRSTSTTATVNSAGEFSITATADLEVITLKTASTNKATYLLGTANLSNFATFISSDNKIFTTGLVAGTAPVSKIVLTSAGNSYTVANGVATTAVTGTGTGLKVDIVRTTSGGSITTVVINNTGIGYAAGDIVKINNGSLTGTATLAIQNINSNGEIIITDNSNGTISGTFKFNTKNATNTEVVNFQYGKFYKIPVTVVP